MDLHVPVIELIAIVLGSSLLSTIASALFNHSKIKAEATKISEEAESEEVLRVSKTYKSLVDSAESLTRSTEILNEIYKKRLLETNLKAEDLREDYDDLEKSFKELKELYHTLKHEYQLRESLLVEKDMIIERLKKEREELLKRIQQLEKAIKERDRIISQLEEKINGKESP